MKNLLTLFVALLPAALWATAPVPEDTCNHRLWFTAPAAIWE